MKGHRALSAESYNYYYVLLAVAFNLFAVATAIFIPGIDPLTKQVRFYPVSSPNLVLDPYRNPKHEVTINSYSDFINFPFFHKNSHFIPIGNSGDGMTVTGNSAFEVNDEINKILQQLPSGVREVTYYQRKSEDKYPCFNVYTGPFLSTHAPPHQEYYRNATILPF